MLGYHGDGYCRGDPTGRSYGGHLVVNVNKPLWIVVEEKVSLPSEIVGCGHSPCSSYQDPSIGLKLVRSVVRIVGVIVLSSSLMPPSIS